MSDVRKRLKLRVVALSDLGHMPASGGTKRKRGGFSVWRPRVLRESRLCVFEATVSSRNRYIDHY